MRQRWLIALLALAVGCTSFSSYQSARLLAPGRSSVVAATGAARVSSEDGLDEKIFVGFEGLYRRGLTQTLEGGVKLSHVLDIDNRDAATLAFVDLKFSILPDELALQLPLGIGRRDGDLHDLQLQPTLIHTMTISPWLEVDTAAKGIFVVDNVADESLVHASLAIGLRLRSDQHRLELHPEIGVLLNDVANDLFDSIVIGVGLAVIFSP